MFKITWITTLVLTIAGAGVGTYILYSPNHDLRDLWVTSAMTTMNHKYLATIFFNKDEINEIMNSNKVEEPKESTDESKIDITSSNTTSQAIQIKDTVDLIDISNGRYKGYLLKISDPSRVAVGTTSYWGTAGMKVDDIGKKYDAVAGINSGGFSDADGRGTGGVPTGIVIENYKILNDDGDVTEKHSLIGFDKDNVLVLGKFTTEEIQEHGIRDAVDFGPFLIVNGKTAINEGNGGWGLAPRTAIGQTADGTVLMLVIDGRQVSSIGATLKDVQDIMLQYGAVNAANLDGGSSATMVYDGKIKNSPCSIYGPRYVPTAFIVINHDKRGNI